MGIVSATCVITTKNRKDELQVAIRSALDQTARPQVLVIDDGSTDGTSEMVRGQFPSVILHRNDPSQGYIIQRNRAARLAAGDVIFSIDDDAAFSTPRVVAQVLSHFAHPRVGAVAIPFVNVNQDQIVRQLAPDDAHVWVTESFIGTAHALRRDLFNALGGYRGHLVHQGEEGDYTIRMLAAGYVVRLGRGDVIHHFESPRRDFRRVDLYGRRNDVLYAWHNVPLRAFPAHVAATTLNGLRFGIRAGRFWRHARGLFDGYVGVAKFFCERRPVDIRTYRLSRLLKARGAAPLEDIEPMLPPLLSVPHSAQSQPAPAPAPAPA